MIDIFTVMVPHALMAIAIWRLIHSDDLDFDPILPGTAEALARMKRTFASTRGANKPGVGPGKDRGPDGKRPRA
ncbi:MAG: hypothetical protein ACKVOL_13525 [Novosphingobium sp.]